METILTFFLTDNFVLSRQAWVEPEHGLATLAPEMPSGAAGGGSWAKHVHTFPTRIKGQTFPTSLLDPFPTFYMKLHQENAEVHWK